MLGSTIALLREYGASATSIDRVLAHSGAPRGSVYHHFPGGRTQLLEEAVVLAGELMGGLIERVVQAEDPLRAVDEFFAGWQRRVAGSDFRSGCPIVAVVVDPHDDAPQLTRSAGSAFADWRSAFTALFRRHGVPEDRARRLSTLIVAAQEGGILLCRAERSIAPLEAVAEELHDLVAHALRDRPDPAPAPDPTP
jgi:AcrR family transcriptional regulator